MKSFLVIFTAFVIQISGKRYLRPASTITEFFAKKDVNVTELGPAPGDASLQSKKLDTGCTACW
uniref:AlNc14C242G9487 protein n=1 Tax=Albugo laibachii Nc14 TaxID=890382 RepID=F0WSZ7_9STRA|nr:AlNc14C242G9487 [Albugo laibachii Nc14]|eukprot:CCA24482.1 AlNc14C242G9487 [Albugo laibachii Nc14]